MSLRKTKKKSILSMAGHSTRIDIWTYSTPLCVCANTCTSTHVRNYAQAHIISVCHSIVDLSVDWERVCPTFGETSPAQLTLYHGFTTFSISTSKTHALSITFCYTNLRQLVKVEPPPAKVVHIHIRVCINVEIKKYWSHYFSSLVMESANDLSINIFCIKKHYSKQ